MRAVKYIDAAFFSYRYITRHKEPGFYGEKGHVGSCLYFRRLKDIGFQKETEKGGDKDGRKDCCSHITPWLVVVDELSLGGASSHSFSGEGVEKSL